MFKKGFSVNKTKTAINTLFVLFGFFVLSGVAFALPSPAFVSFTNVEDSDGDGTIDTITLVFNENVDVIDTTPADSFPNLTLSDGCQIPVGSYAQTGSDTLVISGLTGCSTYNTALRPSVFYTSVADCSTDGAICSSSGAVQLSDGSNIQAMDDANPVILGISSFTADGVYGPGSNIDINVTFSEAVNIPGSLQMNLVNGVSIDKTDNNYASIFSYSYQVGATGSPEDDGDLGVANFIGTVFDVYGNNSDHPPIPLGNNLNDNNGIEIDTTAPTISNGCVSVLGATGTTGFKYLDTPIFVWNNTDICDNNEDVAQVIFDASEFRAVDTNLVAIDVGGGEFGDGNFQATLTGLIDPQDEELNNIWVTAVDDVGNEETIYTVNDYDIDSIPPSFDFSTAVSVFKQDYNYPANDTNMWFYYPGNSIRAEIYNDLESDGEDLAEVRMCVKPLVLDNPDVSCDLTDFGNMAYYYSLNPVDDVTNEVDFDLSALLDYPSGQGAYPLSFWLQDDMGNVNMSMSQDEMLIAVFNINPKDMITELGNPGASVFETTDWSTIEDFTFIPADDLVFNVNDGSEDIARLIFKDDINLCDMTTLNGLSSLATNFTANSDTIRIDSSSLPRLDKAALLMFKVNSSVQPGFIVKDNAGVAIGSIPNDADFADIINFTPASYGYASNFNWDDVNSEMSFEVSGFSQYDTDLTAPTVTYNPASSATGVAVNAPVVLTFSEKMDTSSFAYTLTPNPGSLSLVWSVGDTVATISHSNFVNSTSYSVEITTANDLVGNSLTLPSSASFTTVAASSGGGGGSSFIIGATSTSGTGTPTAISSTVTGTRTLERSIDLNDSMLEEVDVDGESMIQANVTGESGQITLGNDDMTLYIGPNTTVMADANWNGVIAPPSIVSLEKVLSGDKLNVVDGQDVPAEKIDFVLKIGSDNSKLQFSPAVKVEIPVDLPNGTVVQIFVSNDGSEFETLQTVTVVDGKLVFETSHLSYFAFATEASASEIVFADLEGHWAKDYVMTLLEKGVVNGKADGKFAPDSNISRAELTKIALLGFEYSVESSVSKTSFSDVGSGEWYAPFVAKAKEVAIVGGYLDGTFKPNAYITRAEALKVLAKAAGLDPTLTGGVSEFSDVPSDAWYYDYVRMAVGMGVVNGYGDGKFKPNAYITRAEASKILVKMMEMQ